MVVAVLLSATAALGATPAGRADDGFAFSSQRIPPPVRTRMVGRSWRPGCPVALADLRYLRLSYVDFEGRTRTGELVVGEAHVGAMRRAFRRLHAARFPIRRMRLVDDFGASDFHSIEADNTSAFNCRRVTGGTRWSEHAYGRAIDVNPIRNPYVLDGRTSHPRSRPFVRRSPYRRGMAVPGRVLVRAFAAQGWRWGGHWTSVKDYQHFSPTGR